MTGKASTPETMTIGRLADAAGVNLETVRYYERRGLLPEPPRTDAGYRQYGEGDLWRLRFIGRAKRLGFTLAEIAELLDGGEGDEPTSERVLAAAAAKVAEVDASVAALEERRRRLEQLIGVCADGPSPDCTSLRLIG